MRGTRLFLLALSSSLLFALGLPNEQYLMGFPPLGYLALIPLYLALLELRTWKGAALALGLYGALHHAASSYWLWYFQDFALWTLGFTTLAYFVVYASSGLVVIHLLRRAGQFRPLAFALLWTGFEYLKSTGFLAYPWGLLPYTQSSFLPLLQIADTTGVYGLSFVLAFANAALGELFFTPAGPASGFPSSPLSSREREAGPPQPRPGDFPSQPIARRLEPSPLLGQAGFALLLVAICLAYGLGRLASPPALRGEVAILLVQQNLNPWSEGGEAALEANTQLLKEALAGPGPRPDLVLFSESSLGYPFVDGQAWYEKNPRTEPFLPFLRRQGLWLLTGSPVVLDWKQFTATNSVILIDPQGRVAGDYAKIHPVPFAEAIPFFEFSWFRAFLKKAVGLDAGWTMGTKYTVFSLPSPSGRVRFGAPICFEDAFAPLCATLVREGADLLVNLTDDSWSRTKSAEYQHLAAARFRSIETRRSLVRSTNSGVSCLVTPTGEIREELPAFTASQKLVRVPLVEPLGTPYLRLGDWFATLCLLAVALWTFILGVRAIPKGRRAA